MADETTDGAAVRPVKAVGGWKCGIDPRPQHGEGDRYRQRDRRRLDWRDDGRCGDVWPRNVEMGRAAGRNGRSAMPTAAIRPPDDAPQTSCGGTIRPRHSPKPMRGWPDRSQYPRIVTSSPSSRNARCSPVGIWSGSVAAHGALEQTAARFGRRSGDSPTAQQVARPKIAPIARMVCHELSHCPIHIGEGTQTDPERLNILSAHRSGRRSGLPA